jgi:carbamoyltransferase
MNQKNNIIPNYIFHMIILGLNHGEINSSAVLVQDGKIIAGAPEERFNREQKTKSFPKQAIDFCLKIGEVNLKGCDYVAQAWNPGEYWQKFNYSSISNRRIKREDYLFAVPDNLYSHVERKSPKWILQSYSEDTTIPPVYFVNHHLTHAANAFFLSPFEKAAILTCDWRGEFETTTLSLGDVNNIEIISKQTMPHSLGMFYATFTELLGYKRDSDEWKVMALSAFDVDYDSFFKKIRSTIKLTEDGLFELDQSYYQGAFVEKQKLYTQKLVDLLGGREGVKGEEPEKWHLTVAKAMQKVTEEIATHILLHLYKKTNCENLVLGGGFFMNSVFNGKVIQKTPFKNLYVPYAPADVGNSIGAALYVSHCIHNQKRDYSFHSSYIGPLFNDNEIEKTLNRRKIDFKKLNNFSQDIASLISDGKIIALFNGRMEFGERSLGNRSILADPRKSDIKDKINSIIKYRESYRPFAPSVLFEKAHIYFDVPEGHECNFMEKVVPVKEEYRKELPAITHIDGSGRLQTVKKQHNEKYHNIISEVEKLTGYPIILNTSFNVNGEPIVLSPDDAINTFYNSGLEFLIMNGFIVEK